MTAAEEAGLALSLFPAAVVGFALHRGTVCAVKTVAEIMSSRRAFMFLSFVKTMVWVVAISLPLAW